MNWSTSILDFCGNPPPSDMRCQECQVDVSTLTPLRLRTIHTEQDAHDIDYTYLYFYKGIPVLFKAWEDIEGCIKPTWVCENCLRKRVKEGRFSN